LRTSATENPGRQRRITFLFWPVSDCASRRPALVRRKQSPGPLTASSGLVQNVALCGHSRISAANHSLARHRPLDRISSGRPYINNVAAADQSPLSVSSCRSHSGSCIRSRKCQLSPHAPQTTVFPSGSVWPPAVRRYSSLSRREAVCWQEWQVVRIILLARYSPWMAFPIRVIFEGVGNRCRPPDS
jgi:hypothetical protein